MSEKPVFFAFEADFVESLRCIPMQVRFKLDTCGIKLKLDQWHRFDAQERYSLAQWPCSTEAEIQTYRTYLQQLVLQHTQTPAKDLAVDPEPPWHQPGAVPVQTQEQAQALGITIPVDKWANLTPLQRFALYKLSRPGHENRNFLPALQEFKLAE
ncbi:nitrate reductase associated protein [Halomicronema hongdechloris]|nr:nitrate reductase associated protein [Halomicronema hongdechloris]